MSSFVKVMGAGNAVCM